MSDAPPLHRTAGIVVAAGAGLRAGQPVPKQFALWRGKPVVRHSVEAFAAVGLCPLVVVIPEGAEAIAAAALEGLPDIRFVAGGATRQASVRAGLEELSQSAPDAVLIHDAARPIVPHAVIERLVTALAVHDAAIPVLPVVDSMIEAEGDILRGTLARDRLRRVQTPQAFRYAPILAAHRAWRGPSDAGDDAQVAIAAGGSVALVEGDETLHKLTFATDFSPAAAAVRVGTGYDVHRLAEGEELWLCGVRIEHDRGLSGHSDADVAIHALVDALLGAIGAGDIGSHFPPSDPKWRGAASSVFLEHAVRLVGEAGYAVANVDMTIICEAPRIGPHREPMRTRLAELIGTTTSNVSVKATTTEGLGFTGRGEGIAAHAVVSLTRS